MSPPTKGVAMVTGAARRIGLAIAEKLAGAAYDVALHASERSRDEAEAQAQRLKESGVRTCVVVGDLADPAACAALVGEAANRLGRVRVLVNNASVFEDDRVDTLDLDRWATHFTINLRAPILLSRTFVAQARKDDDPAIVNVIDQRVLRPTPQFFSYTLSKSALWTATQTMAQAFAERGVRVNAVGPGPVLPNVKDGDAGFSKEVEGVPLRRAVAPDEIAAAVLYLAEARTVTGEMIAVDAGQHLGWRTPDVVE